MYDYEAKQLRVISDKYVVIWWDDWNGGYMFEIFEKQIDAIDFMNDKTDETLSIEGGICTSSNMKKVVDFVKATIELLEPIYESEPKKKWYQTLMDFKWLLN